ncbi:MAG TPA: 4Fe-4S dicluster domain-containing protein [Thermoanaerobaculia bacterium]|nr:4Fe-4S dicluster domain-containing protein [Thermoanaerobaculia bacterium]
MALPGWTGRFAKQRRLVQLGFFAVFAVLPLFDLFRFDFTVSRFYFFRHEIWLDEWTLIWLALMFAMWLVAAASLILGRVYCAYACPQMVFSEYANDLDALAKKVVRRISLKGREHAAVRVVTLALLLPFSILFSLLFMAYFAPLPEVIRRLASFDVSPWIGLLGLLTAVLFFLDFAFLREKFCRSVCPYGLLQGILEDGRSLHVAYSEATGPCIQCNLCTRVCPMEIDIREGSFQIECTRCGNCIDACDLILGKRKRPGLLAFDFGRAGLKQWDAKRALVGISTVGFGVALVLAIAFRQDVAFRLSPVYMEQATGQTAFAESRFLLRATNKGKAPVDLVVTSDGLPKDVVLDGLADPSVPAGTEKRFTITVRVPRAEVASSVVPFTLTVKAKDQSETFPAALFVGGRRG